MEALEIFENTVQVRSFMRSSKMLTVADVMRLDSFEKPEALVRNEISSSYCFVVLWLCY